MGDIPKSRARDEETYERLCKKNRHKLIVIYDAFYERDDDLLLGRVKIYECVHCNDCRVVFMNTNKVKAISSVPVKGT